MAIDMLVDSTELDNGLTTIADAIRAKGGTSAPLAFPNGMAQAIADIEAGGAGGNYNIESVDDGNGGQILNITDAHGGTEITDGIVVKARNANGYATEIDYYGDTLYLEQFSSDYPNNVGWRFLETINFKSTVKHLKDRFAYKRDTLTALNGIDFSLIETSTSNPFDSMQNVPFGDVEWLNTTFPSEVSAVFRNCKGLTKLRINLNSIRIGDSFVRGCSNLTDLTINGNVAIYGRNGGSYAPFYNCTALQNVVLGNIGTTITNFMNGAFIGCTQSGLTIIAFTNGEYADTLLANIRSGATNATIIIKASEDTTYGGTAYAAGETMITSEVA